VPQTSEILFLPREHKIHIFKLMCKLCSFYYIDMLLMPFLTFSRRFPTTYQRFPKIFQNCSEGQTNLSEHLSNISEYFPKISEDCRRPMKKMRRCFDHTPTKLSVVKGTKEKCYHTWYLHVRISYHFYQFVTTQYTTDLYIIIQTVVLQQSETQQKSCKPQ